MVKKVSFKQMFSTHAYIHKDDLIKQVPLLFILMSRRTVADYRRVFKKLPTIVGVMQVTKFVSDFKRAGGGGCFPVVKNGFDCAIHWTQAVFRKLKKGLVSLYNKRGEAYIFILKF